MKFPVYPDQLRYSQNFFNAPFPSLEREKKRGLKQCSSGLEAGETRGGLTRTTQPWKVGGNTDKSINEALDYSDSTGWFV